MPCRLLSLTILMFWASIATAQAPKGNYDYPWETQPGVFYFFYARDELTLCDDVIRKHFDGLGSTQLNDAMQAMITDGERLLYDPTRFHNVEWRSEAHNLIVDGDELDSVLGIAGDGEIYGAESVGVFVFLNPKSSYEVADARNLSSHQPNVQKEILEALFLTAQYDTVHYSRAVCYTV